MKSKIVFIFIFFIYVIGHSQIKNISTKFELPETVSETSGLLFFNGRLLTHNDSGDGANLYELDTISGHISRTVNITNATNVDWEDITQDETYIYIGDIGNNSAGNRQDLKIYRILKSDFLNNTSVTSEIISFNYEDQTDFTSKPNNTNFDAEALSVYNNKLIIFTKNWVDNTVNAYTIPKSIGHHVAIKVSTYNSNGLITGSTYNKNDDSFLLSGYTNPTGAPFLIYIKVNAISNDNIFSGAIEKTDINPTISASQIEGITLIDKNKYFLSREKVNTVVNGTPIVLTQKLYRFDNGSFSLLNVDNSTLNSIKIFPNPAKTTLIIKGIDVKSIKIFNLNGSIIYEQKNNNAISLKNLAQGIYLVEIRTDTGNLISKKFYKQ